MLDEDDKDIPNNQHTLSLHTAFNDCVMGWSDAIDPINIQLVNPLVEEQAEVFLKRTNLLLPCSDYKRDEIANPLIDHAVKSDTGTASSILDIM